MVKQVDLQADPDKAVLAERAAMELIPATSDKPTDKKAVKVADDLPDPAASEWPQVPLVSKDLQVLPDKAVVSNNNHKVHLFESEFKNSSFLRSNL